MEKIKIEDACEIINGYAFKSDKYVNSGIRVIRITNVQKGYVQDDNPQFYPVEELDSIKDYLLESNDLLLSLTGNVGRVALLGSEWLPAALNQRVACLRPKRKYIKRKYIYYALLSNKFENDCVLSSKGIAQKNLSTEWLKQYVINLPTEKKQAEIIAIFDSLVDIISKRIEEIQKLDSLIQARFVEMFGNENNSKEWDVVNIEKVADVQVGVVIKPTQYYTDENSGIKAFRSLNIGEGYIKDSDWVYFTKEGQEKNSKSILKENDLLIVRSGSPGTACVVTKDYVGCNAVDIIIAHPDCKVVNPYYLCAYTNMSHGKKQILEGIDGAAQQHFNVGKYNKLQLMLPPMKLQDEFSVFVHQVDKLKAAVQKSLDETQLLFDSLMQQYFG